MQPGRSNKYYKCNITIGGDGQGSIERGWESDGWPRIRNPGSKARTTPAGTMPGRRVCDKMLRMLIFIEFFNLHCPGGNRITCRSDSLSLKVTRWGLRRAQPNRGSGRGMVGDRRGGWHFLEPLQDFVSHPRPPPRAQASRHSLCKMAVLYCDIEQAG